eukprot:5059285-Lingulodinium_polyedra.AAC.1
MAPTATFAARPRSPASRRPFTAALSPGSSPRRRARPGPSRGMCRAAPRHSGPLRPHGPPRCSRLLATN